MMPFSYCCHVPIIVVLDKFGSGKIKCQNPPTQCAHQNMDAQTFNINLFDHNIQNHEIPEEQIKPKLMGQKYSKEISRRVINGSYRVFNIQQSIKRRNKSIKKYIDDDIYLKSQFQQYPPVSHQQQQQYYPMNMANNNSINSIQLKSQQSTIGDLQNISSSNHNHHKQQKQRKDYYQSFLEKIDIPSLNVDNLLKEEEIEENQEDNAYIPKSYSKTKSQHKGCLSVLKSGNTSSSITHTEETFIPIQLKRKLHTPDRAKRREQQNEALPSSKLSEFKEIQPLKDIQHTKEFKTLQKIRQRISSLTGHSPSRRYFADNQSNSQLDGNSYNVLCDSRNQGNPSGNHNFYHIKTQLSGSIVVPSKKYLNSEASNINSNFTSQQSYKLISQNPLQNDMVAYTNQNVDTLNMAIQQTQQQNNITESSQNGQQISPYKKQFKHSITPSMYNDYRIAKNSKNSPKSVLNNHNQLSLSPSSARNGNDHNKQHVFQSILRKQLKPYREIIQQLGPAPKIQLNQIGNYKNSINMQKGILI